jgi:D-3-phosphoglycerate dehydrogenase
VQALVSAAVTAEVTAMLEDSLGWETVRVASVHDATARLSDGQRADVAAVVVEAEPIGACLFDRLPALELVACLRGNPVNVDIEAATRRGVPVIYAPGRNAASVADFTLGLLLAMIRNVALAHHGVVDRRLTVDDGAVTRSKDDVIWTAPSLEVRPYERFMGPELSSLDVAVVGYGHVGRATARRLDGLVRRVVVVDPAADPAQVRADGFDGMSLERALGAVDVVSLHARSDTVIVGAAELAAMRPGSYLINTARASVLDYDALGRALWAGHLRGAALDVFPEEPLRSSSPLLSVPGLTLTPHIAGASYGVAAHQSTTLLRALEALYGTGPWSGLPVANPQVQPAWSPQGRRAGETARIPISQPSEERL